MLELITQYGPYAFIALVAVFLYAAGHHVGSATAAALVPETIKTAEADAPKDTVLNKIGQDGKVELELVPLAPKTINDVKSADPAADNLDKILPAHIGVDVPPKTVSAEAIASAQTKVADDITIAEYKKLTKPAGVDAEVAKAHDALDKAGVFGPNRLIAIAAVRAGQVTGEDVARAHPAVQVPQIAKAAE